MESFCQCGAMASYPHGAGCPYPYFGDNPKLVEKWTKEKEIIKHNQLATLQGENGWKYLKSCTEKMTDDEIIEEANKFYQTVKMVSVIGRKDIFPQTVVK